LADTIPQVDGGYRLDFDFPAAPSGRRRVTFGSTAFNYLLAGLDDPRAANLNLESRFTTIHLGTTTEAKQVYGNFTNLGTLRFLLNATSADAFPESITFPGHVQTFSPFQITGRENWTGTITFANLYAASPLPTPSCSPRVAGPDYCRWIAKATKATFTTNQNFAYNTRWKFDDIQIGRGTSATSIRTVTWDVQSFEVQHLRFSLYSALYFTFVAPNTGPTASPIPAPPTPLAAAPAPPATISGEFDLTRVTWDTGYETIVRQHNGSIYSEFSLGTTGSVSKAYWIVRTLYDVSFDTCEQWRSKLQNGIRLSNVPPGFQASLSFSCLNSDLGRQGYGANTGPVEDFALRSTYSGVLATISLTGGNPYQHPLPEEDDSGLSGGAIAGIVIGVVAFVAIIAVVVMVVLGVACFGKGSDASA
jgi:hypothetical protein